MAGSVYFVSIPGLTDGNAGGAGGANGASLAATTQAAAGGTAAYGAQAQSQPEQQQPSPEQQQEHQQQGYDPQRVPYGVTSSPTSTTTNFQVQEHQQQLRHQSMDNLTSPINAGSSHSLNAGYSPNAASTPSWVLPKKDSPGGYGGQGARVGTGVMSDSSNGAAAGAQGLTGRLAAVTLTDPGSASA